jgi:hypothetical protein
VYKNPLLLAFLSSPTHKCLQSASLCLIDHLSIGRSFVTATLIKWIVDFVQSSSSGESWPRVASDSEDRGCTDSLTGCLTDSLSASLSDSLTGYLSASLIASLTGGCLTGCLTGCLPASLTGGCLTASLSDCTGC